MSILLAVFALGILIFVHELGHFTAAKLSGVWVERFSIGFGPRIMAFTRGDTEYCISAIPLGGYVKLHRMLEEEDAVPGKEGEAFFNKPTIKKLFIIGAGVAFNAIFAVLLFSIIFLAGYKTFSATIGEVDSGSVAYVAGFQAGDKISAVNGNNVRSWLDFEEFLSAGANDVTVARAGEPVALSFTPVYKDYVDELGRTQQLLDTGILPLIPPIIGDVAPNEPADKAGLRAGDIFLSINGERVSQWQDVSAITSQHPNEPVSVTILRGEEEISVDITPAAVERDNATVGVMGVYVNQGDVVIRENILTSFRLGAERAWDVTKLICVGIYQMVAGKLDSKDLGGPILIMQEGVKSADGGYERYLSFIALISLNLGILNILPIPVLDGGHMLFYIIEGVTRRQIGAKTRENAQKFGIAALGLLMVFAFYNDIMRFFS